MSLLTSQVVVKLIKYSRNKKKSPSEVLFTLCAL